MSDKKLIMCSRRYGKALANHIIAGPKHEKNVIDALKYGIIDKEQAMEYLAKMGTQVNSPGPSRPAYLPADYKYTGNRPHGGMEVQVWVNSKGHEYYVPVTQNIYAPVVWGNPHVSVPTIPTPSTTAKFKKGDRVMCRNISGNYSENPVIGETYTVSITDYFGDPGKFLTENSQGEAISFFTRDFEMATDRFKVDRPALPKLETVKVVDNCPYKAYNDKYNLDEP